MATTAELSYLVAGKTALVAQGLDPLPEDETDRAHYRPVQTPAMFNQDHPPPSVQKLITEAMYGAVALGIYSLFIFWPGFKVGLKFIRAKNTSVASKRILFTVVGALTLAPAPFPLSMFGPILLVPLP